MITRDKIANWIRKSPVVDSSEKTEKTDGWNNIWSGMGYSGVDPSRSTKFSGVIELTEPILNDLYRGDGFGRRIIDLPTNEMTRQWFKIEGDAEGEVLNELKRIGAKRGITDLLRWSRLYGGAIAVLGIEDGKQFDEPLNENAIKNVDFIRVYDRYRIDWQESDLYQDNTNRKFGMPEWYTITPVTGLQYRVHETRTLRLDGAPVPDATRCNNRGWGDSELTTPFESLMRVGAAYGNIGSIINDFIQKVLTMKGLASMIGSKDGEKAIRDRLSIMDMSSSNYSISLLDEDEIYLKHSSNVSGLEKLLDRFILALSAATGIPVAVLMGQSPAGLNATGDADIRNWYDAIASEQQDVLGPVIERLVYLVAKSKNTSFSDKDAETLSVIFNPLWQPTDKEVAETRNLTAKSDEIYINTGVLDPEEVATSRFGGDTYSMETELSGDRPDLNNTEPDEDAE